MLMKNRDSNPDKQDQNLLCCHYTILQFSPVYPHEPTRESSLHFNNYTTIINTLCGLMCVLPESNR